jgi:pimeloyl-ACP methyl ester carboxylesterase
MSVSTLVKSGGARLATRVVGGGRPIIFVHARVADSRMWNHQMYALGRSNRAVAYDRRGFGKTRYQEEEHSESDDLVAVIDAVAEGQRAVLVGSSQGGGIALHTALEHPSRVEALVLIASNVPGAPKIEHSSQVAQLIERLSEAEVARNIDEAVALRTQLWLDGPSQEPTRVAWRMRKLFHEMNASALRSPVVGKNVDPNSAHHRLHQINVPTLVMCGDLDLPGIQQRNHRLAAMTNGRLVVSNGAAHLPSLERPESVSGIIEKFVEGLRIPISSEPVC